MGLSRFLAVFLTFCTYVCVMSNNGAEATPKFFEELRSVSAISVKPLLRTGYHFQPSRHWMNDPNAPMYYKGLYHLFYQYNPKGSVWGNIVWAHSMSKDLINWEALEHAIYPSKSFDKFGCWSGSATILPGDRPVILYTGVVSPKPIQTQVQNYAIPANLSDPYLREWVKPDNNPVVVADKSVNGSAFRDPTTAWFFNGEWRMLVGGRNNYRGMAYLYRSKDFVHWIRAKNPLHSAETGMWECPDFYPVSRNGENGLDTSFVMGQVKHVLKNSLDLTRYDYYTIGTYYAEHDRYVPDEDSVDSVDGLRYDYGNFYASKTFFDPKKNRRILWGWANESDTEHDDVSKGWAGIQAIPRRVWLDKSGKQLLQWPVEELETLRGNKVEMKVKKLQVGEFVEVKGITAVQADVEVTFSFESLDKAESFDSSWKKPEELCALKGSQVKGGLGPFGLMTLASEKQEEFTPVFFRVFKAHTNYNILMCSDARSSSLKRKKLYKPSFAGFVNVDIAADKKISLRILIDHSVVESFGAGGRTCITSRVYPKLAVFNSAHLYVFNNGTEAVTVENLNAWSMKTPVMNTNKL